MRVRNPNVGCLICGSQVPADVIRVEDGRKQMYRCPKCDDTVLIGLVTGGEGYAAPAPFHVPTHPNDHEPAISDDLQIERWEKWWTDRAVVSLIHGRYVAGNRDLVDFLSKLEDLHDST